MTKVWFAFMAGKGSLEDLLELWEPIKQYFDGLVCTYHGEPSDDEAHYLEANKKDGKVIYLPYSGRHSHSRNTYLWCGPIKQGDLVFCCDVLERLKLVFIERMLNHFASVFIGKGLTIARYYGKPIFFPYHESLEYVGTPHEGLRRNDGNNVEVELNHIWPNEIDVRENVRPRKRDKNHWIKHYARYTLLPWGSNHYWLGLEGNKNASQIFAKREEDRLQFIVLLGELGIERDVDSVIQYMKANNMDARFLDHLERDKNWNDVFLYYVLGQEVTDDHDWDKIKKIRGSA